MKVKYPLAWSNGFKNFKVTLKNIWLITGSLSLTCSFIVVVASCSVNQKGIVINKINLAEIINSDNLVVDNNSTQASILAALQQIEGLERITIDDVDITIVQAQVGVNGKVMIVAKENSQLVQGQVTITIPLIKLDLATIVNTTNVPVDNDSTPASVLVALQKIEGLSSLTSNDVDITIVQAQKNIRGNVKITASTNSLIVIGEVNLLIKALPRIDLNVFFTEYALNLVSDASASDVFDAIKAIPEFTNLQQSDLTITITPPQIGVNGQAHVVANPTSLLVENQVDLIIPSLKVDLAQVVNATNVPVNNNSTQESILASLQKIDNLANLTSNDVTITITKAAISQAGNVLIKANNTSILVINQVSLTINALPKADLAQVVNATNVPVYNDATQASVISSLQKIEGLENISPADISITINKATITQTGSVKIQANTNSRLVINSVTLNFKIKFEDAISTDPTWVQVNYDALNQPPTNQQIIDGINHLNYQTNSPLWVVDDVNSQNYVQISNLRQTGANDANQWNATLHLNITNDANSLVSNGTVDVVLKLFTPVLIFNTTAQSATYKGNNQWVTKGIDGAIWVNIWVRSWPNQQGTDFEYVYDWTFSGVINAGTEDEEQYISYDKKQIQYIVVDYSGTNAKGSTLVVTVKYPNAEDLVLSFTFKG